MRFSNQNTSGIRYFLYARRSQDAEDRQMASIDDQIEEMIQLAERHGLKIVEVISESRSAKKPGRPAFNRMLERIHEGEADGILSWKLNRLSRNPIDGGQISWLLQEGIIKHIQTYSRDYLPSDNVIVMAVELGMANQFVKELSVDVKRGMRKKAERGWFPQRSLPAGYKHNTGYRMGADEIVPDDNFPLVKQLWKLFLTGSYSIADIQREGDRLGIRNSRGNPYSHNAYWALFSNPFYCGIFYWPDQSGHKIRHKGRHKPMITEYEFHQAQKLFRKKGKPTRVNTYSFPYRGPLACGECGYAITAEHKLQCICTKCKKKFSCKTKDACPQCGLKISKMKEPTIIEKVYYHCSKKNKQHKCSQKSVEERDLENQVESLLNSISINPDFYEWAVEALKEMHDEEFREQNELARCLKKRETELRERLKRFVIMRADGEISSSQLTQFRSETEKELAELRIELQGIHIRANDWVKMTNEYLSFAEDVVYRFKNGDSETKRTILATLGSNLILKDKKLCVSMPEPLLNIKQTQDQVMATQGWFERKKALENKGLSHEKGAILDTFSVLCAGLRLVRTYIIDNTSIPVFNFDAPNRQLILCNN